MSGPQIAVFGTLRKVRPERHMRAVRRRMEGRDPELVSDVVEEVIAVVDDVGLMDREDRAGGELRINRRVPMGEDRDEPRNAG